MNWFQKIASPEEYLGTLGAPPETVQWIMSQPNSQFYITQFVQNPQMSIGELSQLKPRQRSRGGESGPTQREIHRISNFHEYGQFRNSNDFTPFQKWVLSQLRQMRTNLNPLQNGEIDYDYAIPMTVFDNKSRQIHDWYRLTNEDEGARNIDISSYSWDQAVALSDEWHAAAAGEGAGLIYEPTNPELIMYSPPEWEGWSIQKVVSENDLKAESNEDHMDNCVGQFYDQVARGEIEVYSLRDNVNHPHVTIGIDSNNEIFELKGHSNAPPEDRYKAYIKEWLADLQKTRSGLILTDNEDGTAEPFDFDFRYINNDEINEEINRIVYKGNEYGLEIPFNLLDIESLYESVIHELNSNNYRGSDVRNAREIGPTIATVAWEADKYRANQLGLINPETVLEIHRNVTDEYRLKTFNRKSKSEGIGWLWEKIQSNDEAFYENFFDYFESYVNQDDFETEEEYEKARDEEQYEYERESRSESLPYALDDEIRNTLSALAREDPFLPEHAQFQKQDSKVASTPSDFPDDVLGDMNLLHEEKQWRQAVSTPGSLVKHKDQGWTGKVIEIRGDPVNGGKVLVEHEMPSGLDEGFKAQRFYSALVLSPVLKMTSPFRRSSSWSIRFSQIKPMPAPVEFPGASTKWRYVYASPEAWLRSQGVPDEILQYALDDNKFPRKMQKWVALQLGKGLKVLTPEYRDGWSKETIQYVINMHKDDLIEIKDWFNHKSATERRFDINRFDFKSALEQIDIWQEEMGDVRGEGNPRYYSQPATDGEELGNGFYMVEVVPDDLGNEGAIMQHCVGDDTQDYREKVESGEIKIFSLRDAGNRPHATIEVQNENEFDVDEFDNDPRNWIYDESGDVVDIDYEAAGDRQAQWVIAQIQGKQNESPVNKYRPFLKTWLENHPEFNPSEDDLLSVTPSPELLQAIVRDKDNPSGGGSLYRKYFGFLDERDQFRLIEQVVNDQGVGWSNDAISDAVSKPVVQEWFDSPLGNPGTMDREKHNAFVRSLTSHDSPDIRRGAYSRMSVNPRYRTPEGLQEFMQVALQEPSAKVVAVILPNFFTYPNKDSTDSMDKYRNPVFTPDLFPFAMQLSDNFKGAPNSQELHSKIVQGLAPQGDPQMIAQAVTNQFVGQRIGDENTYELRHALEKMDTPRFGQVWALIDPILRKFMLSEEIKGYHLMINKHREVIDKYPGESVMRSSNGGLAPPGHGTIYQPEEVQDIIPQTQEQGLLQPPIGVPGREASTSWLTKIASVELMYHGTSDALAPKILSEGLVPGRGLVWDAERAKKDERSRESFGGIYLTNNFMTAWGAARTATEQFGGGRLMTISQVELRSDSLLQDEDKVHDPRGTFDRVMGASANDYFYMQWAANDFYNLEKIVEKYLDEISLNYTTGEPRPGFEDPRQREALKPSVMEFIKSAVMREIAIAVEQEKGSQFPSLKYKYPQFSEMQLSEAEAEYRKSATELMQKTRFLTNTISDFSHNVRTMEPISFRGRNKVVLVAKIHESTYDSDSRTNHYIDGKYNDDAEILYSSNSEAIQMFISDIQEKIGGGLRVRDKNTVYLDSPREQ